MVEVFKTNIQDKITASKVKDDLYRHFPDIKSILTSMTLIKSFA